MSVTSIKYCVCLNSTLPGIQRFSSQNLWYMRQFYLAYHGHEKLQPLVGEISWAKHHNLQESIGCFSSYPQLLGNQPRCLIRSIHYSSSPIYRVSVPAYTYSQPGSGRNIQQNLSSKSNSWMLRTLPATFAGTQRSWASHR